MKQQAYSFITCAVALLTLSIHPSYAIYDVTRYCQLVPNGSKLPSLESCQVYYTCGDTGHTQHSCSTGQSFDKDSQSCKPSSTVNCYYGLKNPCSQSDNTFVANPENCKGFVSCHNRAELGRGNCPNGQIFDGIRQECIYGTCSNQIGSNANGDLDDLCKIMQVNQYFGDFKRCGTWQLCMSSGKLVKGSCANDLVYDAQTRMCLKHDGQMCKRIQVPSYECNALTEGSLRADNYICSEYYTCNGRYWFKNICQIGKYFDVIRNTCISRKLATPIASCNRCQYATVKWANAVDAQQCSHYVECNAGRKIREGTCDTDAYFHEARQICIMGATDLNEYRKTNGACNAAGMIPENPSDGTTNGSSDITMASPSDTEVTTEPSIASIISTPTILKPTTSYTTPSTTETTTSTLTDISIIDQSTTMTTAAATTEITSISPQEKCDPSDKGILKSDPLVCSVYYLCDGAFWLKRECPSQQYFDMFSSRCEDRSIATPTASCDRCQYATVQWVNAVDSHCSAYFICREGRQVAQNTCGTNSYFDENRQACVVGVSNFEVYQKQNGACRKAV